MLTDAIAVEKPKVIRIPPYLVYEIMDGKPIPYRGFESVLNKEKTLEDIMGSRRLQALIISALLRFLYKHLHEDIYEIVTNEAGLHLSKKNNLSTDIGIFEISVLKPETLILLRRKHRQPLPQRQPANACHLPFILCIWHSVL